MNAQKLGLLEFSAQKLEQDNLFITKRVSTWVTDASKRETPKQLFDVFWYEHEICILFADTNIGKSILGVQIGDSISSGQPITGFLMEANQRPVVYVDFELSDKQFQIRYTNERGATYPFHANFSRAELNDECDLPQDISFEKFIIQSIEKIVVEQKIDILIIDNITYLRTDNEKGKDALSLMKELKALKKKYELSILCLAHVPKRDSSKPISRNDLAGSKMLINFCDSAFAIGESGKDSSLRYLKQIKSRNSSIVYDTKNVAVFSISKEDCFLKFDFRQYSIESEHLRLPSNDDRETKILTAKKMKEEGHTNVQIAAHFNVTEGAVRKWFQ